MPAIGAFIRSTIIVLMMSAVSGCDEPAPSDRVPDDQIRSVRQLHDSLALPPSATNVWNFENRFQDAIQLLRFDASLQDARHFARTVLRRDPVPGQPRAGIIGSSTDREWWLSSYPPGGEGGRFDELGGGTTLILQPMGDRARIWLVSSDTCIRPRSCLRWNSKNRD
jgi:hypothetical protein